MSDRVRGGQGKGLPPHPATVVQRKGLPPHPATVQGKGLPPYPATVVQRKGPPPHPATVVQRKGPPHPATVVQRKGPPPHPATVVQPKAPHPATVQGKGPPPHPATVVQRKGPPPHPATVASTRGGLGGTRAPVRAIQRSEDTYPPLKLVGMMQWRSQIDWQDIFTNAFSDKIEITSTTQKMNCMEGVCFAGIYALSTVNLGSAKGVKKKVDLLKNDEIGYASLIDKLLGFKDRNWGNPSRGDVLFFFGTAHVALSLGDKKVLSLWFGPDDDDKIQITTIDVLWKMIVGAPKVHAAAVGDWLSKMLDFFSGTDKLKYEAVYKIQGFMFDEYDYDTEKWDLQVLNEKLKKATGFDINSLEHMIMISKDPFSKL